MNQCNTCKSSNVVRSKKGERICRKVTSGKRALYDRERQMPPLYGQLWSLFVGLSRDGDNLSAWTNNGQNQSVKLIDDIDR